MGDKLSDQERLYLRQRASKKCMSESKASVEDFIETSNDKLLDLDRGDTWKIVESRSIDGGAAAELNESYLYVWKAAGTKVYFRYFHKEGSTISNKYFKIDTDINGDMLESFQTNHCAKTIGDSSISSSAMKTAIKVDRVLESSDNYVELTTSYSFTSSLPAYFGHLSRTLTKKYFKDNSTSTVKKKEVYTTKITALSDETDQEATYTDAEYTNRHYCVVDFTAPSTYPFPFNLKCPSTNDVAPVDVNGDAVVDLDPATEL